MTMPLLRSSLAAAGGVQVPARRDPLALLVPESTAVRLIEVRTAQGNENVVTGWAQLYGQQNDRNEIFLKGSAAKTIKERVAAGRVKINDSHAWMGLHTHGVVTDAREEDRGLWFEAKWSAAASSQDIKTKLVEGILDEWSIEWNSVSESYDRIGDDETYYRIIKEWIWRGLAVCPHSAQGEPTTISVNSALPYADLPLAPMDTPWNAAEARQRVMDWAAGNTARIRRAHVWADTQDGLGIQIADVVNGRLVAVPQAMLRAAGDLLQREGQPEQIARSRSHLDRYFERMRTELNAGDLQTPWSYGAIDALLSSIRLNGGQIPTDRVQEATEIARMLFRALPSETRTTLTAETQDAGPGQNPPTSGTTAASSDDVQQCAARDRSELDELELELSLLT